ncbi:MAG: transcriptional repressor [Bacteroidia bacterium]|nr:transcriptional repressor [Bacteroidia bacterium]
MADKEVIKILTENNLKVTPQRVAVLEVIMGLENHPSAENIVDYIRLNFPHVPFGTVYKILDAFIEKEIIQRVKTENGIIRYDSVKKPHHHLYCEDSERIEDFYDEDLNKLLENYFKKKKIPNFTIKDYKLQIVGKFKV